MRHLSPGELIDAAEGHAAARATAHTEACEACRRQVASLREALAALRDVPDDEPSPLAWDLLAARIGRAVREAGAPKPWWAAWGWRFAPLLMVAVLAATAGVGVTLWHQRAASGSAASAGAVPGADEALAQDADGDERAAEDPSWSLVSDLSAGISLDDAADVGGLPPLGGSERALWQLSSDERRTLASILEAELAESAAAAPIIPGV
ncbi:MAG TPA: hypothetical protein PLE61_12870 [Vicinamibacterales bacterium]|nr:hypothetical protein [Vicinamibacterales bacterium]HPW21692.1 hypothetical protein [Vicinamibacterales bacterium]